MEDFYIKFHLRTRAGGEIDLIIKGSFGTLPIEIKYGSHTSPNKVKFLQSFITLKQQIMAVQLMLALVIV